MQYGYHLKLKLIMILLTCRHVASVRAIDVAELAKSKTACHALITNEIVLGEAMAIDGYDTCRIKRELVSLVERDALRSTVDIHALHASVTLYDTLTTSVVGVATRLAVVREHHEAIVLIPEHLQ